MTTIEDDLRVIYHAMGYSEVRITDYGDILCRLTSFTETHSRFRVPTEEDKDSRAEFARVLLWALKEFGIVCIQDADAIIPGYFTARVLPDTHIKPGATPQQAFLSALAAAIRAKEREG